MLAAVGLYVIAVGAYHGTAFSGTIPLSPLMSMVMIAGLIACGGLLIGAHFWRVR